MGGQTVTILAVLLTVGTLWLAHVGLRPTGPSEQTSLSMKGITEPLKPPTAVAQIMEEVWQLIQPEEQYCLLQETRGGANNKKDPWEGSWKVCKDRMTPPGMNTTAEPACLVYSFGINNEWSFDDDMAAVGCEVYAFDPSMSTPSQRRGERIHFFRTALGGWSIHRDHRGWEVATLSQLMGQLNHRMIDYLKIDVEGDEWPALENMVSSGVLTAVRQIGIELHFWQDGKKDRTNISLDQAQRWYDALKDVVDLGFHVVSLHKNNWPSPPLQPNVRHPDACCYELLLVRDPSLALEHLPPPVMPVPNVVHMIFGLKPDFGDKSFSLVHYLAVKAAFERLRPAVLYMHYLYEPTTSWWQKAKKFMHPRLLRQGDVESIFGIPITITAHRTDMLRLKILLAEGGIYLDLDVIVLRDFSEIRKHPMAMAREGSYGLCNAVMVAAARAPFLSRWLDQYRAWHNNRPYAEYAVHLPLKLARRAPEEVFLLPESAFFQPAWADTKTIFERDTFDFSLNYAVHLWEKVSWAPYLKNMTVASLKADKPTLFGRIVDSLIADEAD